MPERTLIIGTRGSALALRQTQMVAASLRRRHPGLAIAIHEIRTTGDREQTTSLRAIGGQGIFVKELEEALLRGTVDLAVHSLKDLPAAMTPGLVLAAIPRRADARDVLISRSGARLADLPSGAVIGTGAARRIAQVRALRPDCTIADLRGNVDTRLRKALDPDGPYDAIVLALAGLARLRRAGVVTEVLPLDTMLPAPGQGALGLQTRTEDTWARELVAALDHSATRAAVSAERAFLAGLGGGCTAPIAAWGRTQRGKLWLTGMLGRDDGTLTHHSIQGQATDAISLGTTLANELLNTLKDNDYALSHAW
jgi:hydroxymethylbilane synthase